MFELFRNLLQWQLLLRRSSGPRRAPRENTRHAVSDKESLETAPDDEELQEKDTWLENNKHFLFFEFK